MKKIIILIILAAVGWKLYGRTHSTLEMAAAPAPPLADALTIPQLVKVAEQHFTCDGRLHCSQMISCEEATYFLKNCPGTKMDGDGDGIPCERQHCL